MGIVKNKPALRIKKHRGHDWTVKYYGEKANEITDWLIEQYGEEDFENGPWIIIWESWEYTQWEIFNKELMIMFILRWSDK